MCQSFLSPPYPPPKSLPSPPSYLLPHPTWECLGRGVIREGRDNAGERKIRRNKRRISRDIERSIRILERSHYSPCERWVAWSTARTNATNGCLYLPTFLCYHFVLHYITGWREAEPVWPMCNSATYTVCPVNRLLTCCFPSYHFPATGHVDDWSLHDEVAPPIVRLLMGSKFRADGTYWKDQPFKGNIKILPTW